MDPGEYMTNTLLINNVSTVTFKIYEPTPPSSSPCAFAASDVEHVLRNEGHLVYADPLRRAIWCFSLGKPSESSLEPSTEPQTTHSLDPRSHNLMLVEEGTLESISLFKNRIATPNVANTPSTSSPSGQGLDLGHRPPLTPGGAITSSSFISDSDLKSNLAPSMDLKSYGSTSPKDIHEYFVASVLATLSQRFCSKSGAIPLDARTLILPSETPSADFAVTPSSNYSMFASLRVHLTTTGSLLIGISLTSVEGIWAGHDGLSAALPVNGSTVMAAPMGLFGTYQTLGDFDTYSIDGSAVHSPDTQITRYKPDQDARLASLRSTYSTLLGMKGISAASLAKSSWLSIQLLRRRPNEAKTDGRRTPLANAPTHILWPAVLCYRKRMRTPVLIRDSFEVGQAGLVDDFDALKEAQQWFQGNVEREDILAKRKKEREATNKSKEAGELDSRLLQSGFSPVAPRRPSTTGTSGGVMYPTPPDGVQNAVGMPPSTDSTTLSPGNNMPSTVMVDMDTSLPASRSMTDAFGDGWDGPEVKREQSFSHENWDLNNDVFVENDITDADFNFFDDDNAAELDNNIQELPELDNGLSGNELLQRPDSAAREHTAVSNPVKREPSPAPPVFAKPELKHARSILERHRDPARAGSSVGLKRHPSPFDPATVYKRLRLSITVGGGRDQDPARRGSAFDKLNFDNSFIAVNKKYEHNGRFDFTPEQTGSEVPQGSNSPPTTGYLRRHGKSRSAPKEVPNNLGAQVAGMAGTMDRASAAMDGPNADESTSDADDISLVSDQDDLSDFSDEPSSPMKLNAHRRRFMDDNESLAPSTRDFEIAEEHLAHNLEYPKLQISDGAEIALAKYFADPEPVPSRALLSDDEYIMVAQILTEQAVSGLLDFSMLEPMQDGLETSRPRRETLQHMRNSLQILQGLLPPCLQTAMRCTLRQLVDIQDVPLLSTPSRIQPRPPGGPEQRPSLVQIVAPHLELRRYETKLSVLPSAVHFWESLGLGPSQGPKDIYSVCVFPNLDGMGDNADSFLNRLGNAYESLKLGSFERMPSSPTIANGLLPFEVDKATNTPTLSQGSRSGQPLVDDMAKLAVAIFNTTTVPKNFVVFFVYTPDNPSTIVEACLAFQRMFELYKRALTERKKHAQNELVLQLIPLNLVATSTSLVVLSPNDCTRLSLEVYDRCTLFGGPMPSPAIVLEQQLVTQGISFQLRNQPSANLLQENSVMHIAYAQSVDERWITAAWTDNRGCKQMTASYCLGRKGKPLTRSFSDIAHEIWTTTQDLTSIWKINWRIIVTKVGAMDQQEINDWIALAQAESKSMFNLVIMTVDTKPSLQLIPNIPKPSVAGQTSFYTTPASTPQPAAMSPEAGGNPPTPKGGLTAVTSISTPGADSSATEVDADASLVDITDTTWGAILSHRLNTSNSLTDPTPALISGYLIKRGGSCADDDPAVMEVNVVHCEGNPRGLEVLLREMLSVFRGLGTIARTRSVTEQEADVRPWHVAAVEKAVRTLYQLM